MISDGLRSCITLIRPFHSQPSLDPIGQDAKGYVDVDPEVCEADSVHTHYENENRTYCKTVLLTS